MNKSIILFAFITASLCRLAAAQDIYSIQVNGGVVSPMSSSKGLTGSIQLNYSLNKQIIFYFYSGYTSWDRYKIKFPDNRPFYSGYGPKYFNSYSEDNHSLIPIYIGSRINFHSNQLLTSFVDFEIGYSFLSYNSYDQRMAVNPGTGEITGYYPDVNSKQGNKENLFGIGIGLGLSHSISNSLDLLIAFKLNSYINENYYGLFSTRGTYTAFIAGINFNL